MKSIDKFVLVLVASLALLLAGCGGGSSSTEPEETGPTPEEIAMQRAEMQTADLMAASTDVGTALLALSGSEPTQAQIDAVNEAIDDLEAALMAAADVGDAVKAGYQAQVSGAKNTVMNAEDALMAMKDEADKEAAAAMMAMAKKLYGGLTNTPATNMANQALSAAKFGSLGSSDVKMDRDGDGTAGTTIKMSSTAVASLGGWAGGDYVKMAADGTTDHVVLYNNRGTKSEPFNKKHSGLLMRKGSTTEFEIIQAGLTANVKFVKGDDFATAGTKPHTKMDGDEASVDGTFDGVAGKYSCEQANTAACTSMVDGNGNIVLDGGGGWTFVPSSLTAPTQTPDTAYLVYGWWSRETSAGVDVVAIAGANTTVYEANSVAAAIDGTATYKGGAAGKYAVYNPLGDDSSAGAFTANATLTADFTNDMISGELTDFMSGGESMDWMVELGDGAIGNSDSDDATNNGITGGMTTWSMGETSGGDNSGMWSGDFYRSNGAAQDAEDAQAPAAVTGTFNAGYRVGGLHLGQMAGAFGADLDD